MYVGTQSPTRTSTRDANADSMHIPTLGSPDRSLRQLVLRIYVLYNIQIWVYVYHAFQVWGETEII